MADDKNVTDQEEVVVDEGEAAFNEDEKEEVEADAKATDKEEDKPDKDDKTGDDTDKDKDEDPDKDKDPDKDDKDKKEKDEVSDSQKRLDARIKTVKDEEIVEDKPEEKKPEEKKPEDKKEDQSQDLDVSAIISDLDVSDILNEDDLSDDIKEYSKEYPEDFKAIKELSGGMAKNISAAIVPKIVEKMIESGEYVKASDVKEQFGKLNTKVSQMSFDTNVAQRKDEDGNLKHPDYHDIVYGADMKNFHSWLGKQSKKVQSLGNSLDPDDGDLLLDNYKESSAKKKTSKHDKKQADKKKEHDDIHKSTKNNKTNQTQVSGQSGDPDKEAEDAFNEAD